MNNFDFFAPTEVIFGRDAQEKTGTQARKFGARKVMLVTGGGSVVRSGLLRQVEDSLTKEGIPFVEFAGARPNPTLVHACEGIRKAVNEHVDMIIAVGGGSTIDTAKAIAHGTANPDHELWDIWTRKVALEKSLPIGAVLTIPAAGSEMSDSAVLTNEEIGKKSGINTPFNRCRFAIMNPEVAFTLPDQQLAAGITDIMMHTMERYFIPGVKCDLTDEIAEGLLRTVIKNGRILMKDKNNYDAMAEIMWAGSLSHNNLTECGRGKDFSVHKLGHALSARYDVTHGASLSAVWGSWAQYLYMDAKGRFAQYAERVWQVQEDDTESAAAEGIKRTIAFFREIGMPVSLKELGVNVSEQEIHALALDATMNDTAKLSRIRPLNAEDVAAIYRMALK
ncbi:MAG: iron-containing alcohol dehydrogenase [Butyrivibrio sp.]|jgi:alcohol dehydrogenase YqhD (iron-dependent ADH family)|nr:iron-containing alcohol dehydrogenase [Butyrivibrio sp.]